MQQRGCRRVLGLRFGVLALVAVLGAGLAAHAQEATAPETITWYIPLWRAADLLPQRYAKPVTYEDPTVWLWRGVMDSLGRLKDGREALRVKEHTLVVPDELTPDRAPTLNAALVAKMVEAYNQQNPGQLRFGVLESKLGFHIVPVQVPDETGKLVPANNLLDTRISVPVEKRTATEHLTALCRAVTAATGRALVVNGAYTFDGYFGANGYRLPQIPTDRERPYMLFEWGASETKAREALADLVDRAATTMTWVFVCELIGPPADRKCHLGILPLHVGGRAGAGSEGDDSRQGAKAQRNS